MIEILEVAVEKTNLKEKVDIIVSEPIGFLLVHERMLESFIKARDMYLKPGGLMFPSHADILVAPFTDDVLFAEQATKSQFWKASSFYGIDLRPLAEAASQVCLKLNFFRHILFFSHRFMSLAFLFFLTHFLVLAF